MLGDPDWLAIPWSVHPKRPKDELGDILAAVTAVVERLACINGLQTGQVEERRALSQGLQESSLLCRIRLQNWARGAGSIALALASSNMGIISHENSAPMPSLRDFAMAHLALLYWAIGTMLYEILSKPAVSGDNVLSAVTSARQACRNTLILLQYFERPGVGLFFIQATWFPVIVAADYLARNGMQVSGEFELLQNALRGRQRQMFKRFIRIWHRDKIRVGDFGGGASVNSS